jgi:hypothetical protein
MRFAYAATSAHCDEDKILVIDFAVGVKSAGLKLLLIETLQTYQVAC